MQTLLFAVCAVLVLASVVSAARPDQGLFGRSVRLPEGARPMMPTHLADLVQRRSLLQTTGSYGAYSGYGYSGYSGYGYGGY